MVGGLLPGTYASTETLPSSWVLELVVCDDGASHTPSSGSVGTRTATFKLDAGETVTCTFTNSEARLTIVKSASPATYSKVGDLVTYTITATNIGSATLTGVTVSDPLVEKLPGWTCAPTLPASLAPGQSVVCRATYTVTQADLDAGSLPNSACADSTETAQVCDDLDIPAITLEVKKTADQSLVPITDDGVPVTFTFTVTNTSEVPVSIGSLVDSDFGVLKGDADCKVGTVLPPDGSCSFKATFPIKPDAGAERPQGPPRHEDTFTARVWVCWRGRCGRDGRGWPPGL